MKTFLTISEANMNGFFVRTQAGEKLYKSGCEIVETENGYKIVDPEGNAMAFSVKIGACEPFPNTVLEWDAFTADDISKAAAIPPVKASPADQEKAYRAAVEMMRRMWQVKQAWVDAEAYMVETQKKYHEDFYSGDQRKKSGAEAMIRDAENRSMTLYEEWNNYLRDKSDAAYKTALKALGYKPGMTEADNLFLQIKKEAGYLDD